MKILIIILDLLIWEQELELLLKKLLLLLKKLQVKFALKNLFKDGQATLQGFLQTTKKQKKF